MDIINVEIRSLRDARIRQCRRGGGWEAPPQSPTCALARRHGLFSRTSSHFHFTWETNLFTLAFCRLRKRGLPLKVTTNDANTRGRTCFDACLPDLIHSHSFTTILLVRIRSTSDQPGRLLAEECWDHKSNIKVKRVGQTANVDYGFPFMNMANGKLPCALPTSSRVPSVVDRRLLWSPLIVI